MTMDWLASGCFDKPYQLLGCHTQRLQAYQRVRDVGYIRDQVGPNVEVRTIDVKTQKDGPKMSLGEWCEYWEFKTGGAPDRRGPFLGGGNSTRACRKE